MKIEDCKKRVKLYKEKGDIEKAAHFQKLGTLLTGTLSFYSGQLKNLEAAVRRCKLEEEMIQKISLETRRNIQGNNTIDFSELDDNSFSSQQSGEFLKMLEDQMVDESLTLKPIETIKGYNPKNKQKEEKNKKAKTAKKEQKIQNHEMDIEV